MKSVLISIRPQWCEKIASGEKTIEVRKTAPKEVPFKCYIYCSKDNANEIVLLKYYKNRFIFGDYRNADGHFYTIANGKVIGEFICDKFFILHDDGGNADLGHRKFIQTFEGSSKDNEILSATCLSQNEMFDYIGENNYGYGWHISDLKIYDKPKELSEFERPCPYQGNCRSECQKGKFKNDGILLCSNKITRPPQSYMFVEEV